MFVVCFCTCLSADFWLTMWMKSTGVAVYKSQCSLSRMILSMRRISAVEKLHPLCITRSLMEPITCVKRHKTKKGNKYRFERTLLSLSVYPHLIFLVDFGRQHEGGKRDASQVFWLSLKNTKRLRIWISLEQEPQTCRRAQFKCGRNTVVTLSGLLPWQWTAGGWGCRLPVQRCPDRSGRAGSSLPAKGSFLGAALKRCLCPEKETTVGQNYSMFKTDQAREWLTWMDPFLKTGTFQRRSSLIRAASSRTTSRRLSTAPGCFMVSREQARLDPGHKHLTEARG